mmetsp:Transcript_43592/g.105706  ORF Transcript_43592/g.105706 Transcript_43592/m.105706 type:complete len:492 (-) Transcript_43592:375-1850(-)
MDIGIFVFSTVVYAYSCRGRRPANSLRDRLLAGTSRDASERVSTVSADNVPTPGGALRSEMRLQNLWHRATYILVIQEHSSRGDNDNDRDHHYNGNAGGPTVFVQKRSPLKDYCPSKLDVTPGGVVGFKETYQENAEREIFEEMGIDVSPKNKLGNTMTRLFTFPYEDDIVRVWGDFYEVHYYGSREDLVVQKEEVEDVLVMSMDELRRQIDESPDKFMPDSCHAMRLYFQRTVDVQVNRRLLGKGYSSGDLDCYGLRPKPSVIFMDCDDCLYFDGWKTAGLLTQKIEDWCVQNAGLPPGKAYELYKQYGTALKGLLAEGYIENTPEAIDQFLQEVHDIPIHELIRPDPALRDMLLKLDPDIPKYVFTASVSHHAVRCLKALGIEDIFEDVIIDVKQCDLETKHSVHSFHAAMKIADIDDPESCVFFDDNVKNIKAAREIGWRSILVGKIGRDCGKPISSDNAELEVERIHDIADVLPELFDYSLGSEEDE